MTRKRTPSAPKHSKRVASRSERDAKAPLSPVLRALYERHVAADPELRAIYDAHLENAAVGRQIQDLRRQAGLSQRALAARIGTTASVICRLESADYSGHSLDMLRRIATALNRRVEIRFVPARRTPPP